MNEILDNAILTIDNRTHGGVSVWSTDTELLRTIANRTQEHFDLSQERIQIDDQSTAASFWPKLGRLSEENNETTNISQGSVGLFLFGLLKELGFILGSKQTSIVKEAHHVTIH